MTYLEYADELSNQGYFDNVIDESYWDGGCDVGLMLKMLKAQALKNGVELTHGDDFDYEDYFWQLYKNTEKGLS